jgi:hypothetical protein
MLVEFSVHGSAQQLRQHADHCRDLAHGHISERTRLILRSMANEFDQQARKLDEIDHTDGAKTP